MKFKIALVAFIVALICGFFVSPHDDRFSKAAHRGWDWQEVQMGQNGLWEAVQSPLPKRIGMSIILVVEELIP